MGETEFIPQGTSACCFNLVDGEEDDVRSLCLQRVGEVVVRRISRSRCAEDEQVAVVCGGWRVGCRCSLYRDDLVAYVNA